MRIEKITSASNPKIRELLALSEKAREREEKGLFIVEGIRETRHCFDAGYVPRAVFHSSRIADERLDTLLEALPEAVKDRLGLFEVSDAVYSRIAYRDGTEGIVSEVYSKPAARLDDIVFKGTAPLIAVTEAVEKPGNIGAIMRSVDACGADALLVCDSKCDIYGPNTIRSSIGAAFRVQTVKCTGDEAINWLKGKGIRILTAQLQDSRRYYDTDMKEGCAIVLGSEDKGLSRKWREAADSHIRIPMLGSLDSLNVSVSAAILLYEAVRQRNSPAI